MARPSSISDTLIGVIADGISRGNYPEIAARAAGVSRATYYLWLERGRTDREAGTETLYTKFLDAIKEAEAAAEGLLLETIRTGQERWQSAAWILERRWRERWASPQAHHDPEERALRLRKLATETEAAEVALRAQKRAAGEEGGDPAEGYQDPSRVDAAPTDPAAVRGASDDLPTR